MEKGEGGRWEGSQTIHLCYTTERAGSVVHMVAVVTGTAFFWQDTAVSVRLSSGCLADRSTLPFHWWCLIANYTQICG